MILLEMVKTPMYLYLISHKKKDIKTHTYIGCTSDFIKRLSQHNGESPGGPRMTKRAAGHWQPVVILLLPEDRKFKSKELKKEWKQSSRGLESRIRKAFSLALQHKLKVFLTTKNINNTQVLKYLKNKWKDDKLKLSASDWNNITN